MRNVYCGVLTAADAGKTVELAGWVYRRRDHGGLIFFDLRDVTGIVQVVFSPAIAPSAHAQAHEIKPEYVVTIKGTVSPRPEGTENPNIPTGQIEVLVSSFSVLNTCKPLPFQTRRAGRRRGSAERVAEAEVPLPGYAQAAGAGAFSCAQQGLPGDTQLPDHRGVLRDRDAVPHQKHTRRREGLHRAVEAEHRAVLCPAPVAASSSNRY